MQKRQSPVEIPNVSLGSVIGVGGLWHVWRGHHRGLDRPVAVKIGRAPIDSPVNKARFERECATLRRLNGLPNILEMYAFGVTGSGYPYLVNEYADRSTLEEVGGSLLETELVNIGVEICDSVSAAHELKVFHRNLKPANIFFISSGRSAIGDFGITKLYDDSKVDIRDLRTMISFTSPEILKGREPVASTDVYGIAITLAAAAIGRSPFFSDEGRDVSGIVRGVLSEPPIALSSTSLSLAMLVVLTDGMAKSPRDRPANPAEFKAHLQELKGPSRLIPPETQSTRKAKAQTEKVKVSSDIAVAKMTTADSWKGKDSKRRVLIGGVALALILIAATVANLLVRIDDQAIRVNGTSIPDETELTFSQTQTDAKPDFKVDLPDEEAERASDQIESDDSLPGGFSEAGELLQPTVTIPASTTSTSEVTQPADTVSDSLPIPAVVPAMAPFVEPQDKEIDLVFQPGVSSINKAGRLQGDERHMFFFEAEEGKQLDVMFTNNSNPSSTHFTVFNPDGEVLAQRGTSPLSKEILVGGKFRLVVEPVIELPGDYNIQLTVRTLPA